MTEERPEYFRCTNCIYFKNYMHCCRKSPVFVLGQFKGSWPIVDGGDYCGDVELFWDKKI